MIFFLNYNLLELLKQNKETKIKIKVFFGAWVICEPRFKGSREICELCKNVNLKVHKNHVNLVHISSVHWLY